MTAPAPIPAAEPLVRVVYRRGDPTLELVAREWIVTNGLGGYASGTIGGAPTRRFHGLLVAALPAPLGRTMMVNHVIESLRLRDGTEVALGGLEPDPGPLSLPDALLELRLENGRPTWLFEHAGVVLEKSLVVPHRRNTAHVLYRLLAAPAAVQPLTLRLEPLFDVRSHDAAVAGRSGEYEARPAAHGTTVLAPHPVYPPIHVLAWPPAPPASAEQPAGAAPLSPRARSLDLVYRIEQARGYDCRGPVHAVGYFDLPLAPGQEATLTVSVEGPDETAAVSPAEARRLDDERRARLVTDADPRLRDGPGAELVLAADQFIITPRTRPADQARLEALGDDARTVIAGYPWFTDWGRDTMISLEGLTLATGRRHEARDILHTFAQHIRDGLIPNLFPEGESEGLYHTADATLWFFHAIDRYERITGDVETRRQLLPRLVDIVQRHLGGTRFGIGVDPHDGLLRQGAEGYQLTWMDAKVGDWVVTPRRGKAVEINALFYNALCLMERWLREAEDEGGSGPAGGARLALSADDAAMLAASARRSFNQRFWFADGGYLYDVIDGEGERPDDASLRPNQLLAISLPHPVLDRARWASVLHVVRDQLVTPFGLRSLGRHHADYKPRYDGDLRARDAAYHQGTVWMWLLGPLVDAWLKAFPEDRAGARGFLGGLDQALSRAGGGTLSEIFDAEPPFLPRGCFAQAWSVAEALRALLATSSG